MCKIADSSVSTGERAPETSTAESDLNLCIQHCSEIISVVYCRPTQNLLVNLVLCKAQICLVGCIFNRQRKHLGSCSGHDDVFGHELAANVKQ